MKNLIFVIIAILYVLPVKAQKNNLAPSKPVTENYFGTKIIDEYRNLEDLQNAGTINWMQSQTNYTNSILNQIPKKNYYVEKRLEFDRRQGYSISDFEITDNDKYFYLKKNGDEKIARLYYKEGFLGQEVLLYDPAMYKENNGSHSFVINYISPSSDGSKIAVSMSEKGKELSEIIILDVKTKYVHPEIITNSAPATFDGIKWIDDNTGFIYVEFSTTDPTSQNFYKNTRTVFYKIGTDPNKSVDVFSAKNNPDLHITEDQFPIILDFSADDQYYIGMLVDFQSYRKTFIIRKQDLLSGKKNWRLFSNSDDKAKSLTFQKDKIFFISGYNTSLNKLCKTSIINPDFKNGEVLIPEKKDEIIKSYTITKDGIYYTTTKNGVEAKLYLYKNGQNHSIELPYPSGDINLRGKGENHSDIWITCSGWANDEQRFKYDLKTNSFKPENLTPITKYPEFQDIIVNEIIVKSRDGQEIPVSLLYNKNIKKDGKNMTLISSYGSYGISNNPYFSPTYLLWVQQGGVVAIAHVRGGGEKGEEWRLGGYKETKPNTWRDLIDCTEYLIKEKYTSQEKVAIWGSSAGGITVGRAMTERPDLFKVVIAEVGVMNPLRDEITPNGQPKEFGTVNDPKEFKSLLEMDAYQHIKKGEKYPATFITGGINDQRVIVWEPVKYAAKLMFNDASSNPQLLKIDFEGGHGNNVAVDQRYTNIDDIFTFAFWQLGHPDYRPKEQIKN
ncbi:MULTISPECIES: prolyl oligopeptidase family serine peptidase [Chryseobacterium]|uniref:prolyl oligopeptidase family serine peptidase n=1 Tax=Chryseobacterium TaxID=59732 RepID=UPI0007872E23|nr:MULTISPECIES: prolyl oligopeptidase family serine peptidase [Chryseobacterium]KYH04851.1 prolyl oligopeptidase [Chryseobacterium cucumeris]QWT88297.1 S9 family peptidase [Chryseobacterium sp. PCH239]WFB66880.1 prolyl oligopeptidase family serine peptidase [Chryseobacterium sp. WX]